MKNIKKKHVFGILLTASPLNLKFGIPVLVFFIISFFKKTRLPKTYQFIVFLLLLKIAWIAVAHLLIGTSSTYSVFQLIIYDFILLLMMFITLDRASVSAIFTIIILLFLVDLIFNLNNIFFDVDLLGRHVEVGVIFKRLIGVFGHPYATINISVVAFFIGVFFRSKTLMIVALISLFMTASLRGPLAGIVILVSYFLLYCRFNRRIIFFTLLGIIALVFFATVIHANYSAQDTGNYFRALKWGHALTHIIDSPIIGTQIFPEGEYAWVGNIKYSTRNAESMFLGNALDFGVIVAMITPTILYILMRINIKRFYYSDKSRGALSAALVSMFAFSDYFYGSFYGSILPSLFFSILVVSHKGLR